jgi:hypothetical protein
MKIIVVGGSAIERRRVAKVLRLMSAKLMMTTIGPMDLPNFTVESHQDLTWVNGEIVGTEEGE